MEISWDDARIFLEVAETGSFSAAAISLKLGQPTVSRRIGNLELDLGLVLFNRGRRGTTLTEEGARLVPHVRQMARWAAEFEAEVSATERTATGKVTIAAPPGIGTDIVVPFARSLRETHPELILELLAGIEYLDLTRGDADLAFRSKPSDDPALVTLSTHESSVVPMCTPEYAESLPDNATPADIDWICWGRPYLHLSPGPQLSELIPDFEPVFASDDYLLQLQGCESGIGAMFLPRNSDRLFKERDLVELELSMPELVGRIHLVCARSLRYVPRIVAVLDALDRYLGR